MIRILIVDDSDEKILNITKLIKSLKVEAAIHIASDLINARRSLNDNKYDLLVLDQFLPIRFGEEIEQNGGVNLIKEIQRSTLNNIPRHIFGLSVSNEVIHDYYFPFFVYDERNTWIKHFKSLINYIHLYNKRYLAEANLSANNSSIYLEGPTDFIILSKALQIYFPEVHDKVRLQFENGGGCSWVVRQLFANVYLLPHRKDGSRIKCSAVFDYDLAGKEAIHRISKQINNESAERKHFKVFHYRKKLSPILRLIDEDVDVLLESLYPPSIWVWAYKNNYLVRKESCTYFFEGLEHDLLNESIKLVDPNFPVKDQEVFIEIFNNYYFADEYKKVVANELINRDEVELIKYLLAFKFLLTDIFTYLNTNEVSKN